MDDTADIAVQAETEEQMLELMKAEIGENGFQRKLDDRHIATFIDRGPKLLMTFEKVDDTLRARENGLPLGMDFVEDKNWSLLHVAARGDTWFRSPAMYDFIDELVDLAFFEEFDQVTFYGAGMSGYAAAAYSVAAPGSTVLVLAPQASLERERTLWEERFPQSRRLEFAPRYGWAPDMVEGAERAFVVFDPVLAPDAMHASLFQTPNVTALKCRHFDSAVEFMLEEMGVLHQVIDMAAAGTLTEVAFYKLMRGRHSLSPYFRNLLTHLETAGTPWRMAKLCQYVLSRQRGPVFRKRLKVARNELAKKGPLPDWLEAE